MSSKLFAPVLQSYAAPIFDIKQRMMTRFGAFEKTDRAPDRPLRFTRGGSGIVLGSQHGRDCKGLEHCVSSSEPVD
jgi:hypothetical protein